MDTTIIIFCIFIIAAIIGFIVWRMKNRNPIAKALQKQIDALKVETRWTNVLILSEKPLKPEFFEAIQDGFTRKAAVMSRKGWANQPAEYRVCVFPSIRDYDAAGNYNPSFRVPITEDDPYYSTEYRKKDKDGYYILAAEQVFNEQLGTFFIAEYKQDWRQASDAVYFGLEHIILWHNDRTEYENTKFHGTMGHPIIL